MDFIPQKLYSPRGCAIAIISSCGPPVYPFPNTSLSHVTQGTTVAAIGYKMDLGAMTMRGRINSLGTVAASVEKRLDPIPGALMVSGRINHWTDEAKFGIGLLIG